MENNITEPTAPNEPIEKGGILGIFESKKAKDAAQLVEVTGHATALDEENTQLHKIVAERDQKITQLEADIKASRAEIEKLTAAVEAAEKSVPNAAAAIAAQSHVEPANLPTQPGENSVPADEAALESQLQELKTHAEKIALIKKYKAAHVAKLCLSPTTPHRA